MLLTLVTKHIYIFNKNLKQINVNNLNEKNLDVVNL